ncbi:SDR family oxidoreductase [archaeon]|nr:SDR family oxidoreductase [archaeon]
MLKDKVIIITGSTSGIGKAGALLFAKYGAKVVVTGRRESKGQAVVKKIKKQKGKAIYAELDVTKEESIKEMVKTVIKKWGRIDALWNNAGVEAQGLITEASQKDIDKIINVNLKGMMLCCKHVIPKMKKKGSIINTASIAGLVGFEKLSIYGASKGGIIALTRDLAMDYAKKIRVNVICPGVIWTPMVKRYIKDAPDKEAAKKGFIADIPMGRMGKPEEVAELAAFLASDKSSYLTGSIITVDGGYTVK